MTKHKLYLWIQAAVCVALAALLCGSAVAIYREGAARRAENPMESIYTPEIAAERFAPIAPLFFASVGLLVAGLVLGVSAGDGKPTKDPELLRDLVAGRVARPSEAMRGERTLQRRLLAAGWGAFALCMVPVVIYLASPAHFPQEDLEGMFRGLIRALLPWTAAGLGALAAAYALRERSFLREAEAARAQLQAERAEGVRAEPKLPVPPGAHWGFQAAVVVAALLLIVAGMLNGGARDVLYKAITICTECVGLG